MQVVPANLRSEIRVSGPAGTAATVTVDQLSGVLRQVFGIKWAMCP
jgi:hypothetical protein